jgi:hypothetical protein
LRFEIRERERNCQSVEKFVELMGYIHCSRAIINISTAFRDSCKVSCVNYWTMQLRPRNATAPTPEASLNHDLSFERSKPRRTRLPSGSSIPPPVTRSPTVLIAQPFSPSALGPHAQPANHPVFVESNPLENLRDQEQVIDQSRVESLNENSDQPRRANRQEQQQSASAARSQGAGAEVQSNEPGTEEIPA